MRFMKGKTSMNQITLNVKLYSENEDNDILGFMFADGESKVNLNSERCQAELKKVFSKLIKLSLEKDVTLSLVIDEAFSRNLYKDVCSEYIKDLQNELDQIRVKIRKEMPKL